MGTATHLITIKNGGQCHIWCTFATPTAPQHLVCRVVQSLHINHMQTGIIEVFICRRLHMITSFGIINKHHIERGRGGGGTKQSARHHPTTLKSSLRASEISYYFLQGVWRKKVMRCQSLGGGGGGGGLCL